MKNYKLRKLNTEIRNTSRKRIIELDASPEKKRGLTMYFVFLSATMLKFEENLLFLFKKSFSRW